MGWWSRPSSRPRPLSEVGGGRGTARAFRSATFLIGRPSRGAGWRVVHPVHQVDSVHGEGPPSEGHVMCPRLDSAIDLAWEGDQPTGATATNRRSLTTTPPGFSTLTAKSAALPTGKAARIGTITSPQSLGTSKTPPSTG